MTRIHFPVPALAVIALAAAVSACAPAPGSYVPSQKSAVELRTIQTRVLPVNADAAMRGVIATMHDLGYRITKVSPDAMSVSGTRQSALRLAAVVQPRGENSSAVRANASIVSPRLEAQVDSAEFYAQNFFRPLEAMIGRQVAEESLEAAPVEAMRPVAELNTEKARKAAAEKTE
ncbi:hypothetical protein ACQ5SO_03550 [Rhodovulum sp. DZ06]|uniref:hypothetical protein n=1 Tax=Rhodovulum sp. DZ06 TaxID=3425126 RepID=UPI003D35407A